MNKPQQIKSLTNGNGIKYLIDAAREIFHNPILIYNTSYNLLAHTDDTIDDPIWEEMTSTGTYGLKTKKFFAKEYVTENLANTDKCTILKDSQTQYYGIQLKYDRMAAYVFNKENIKVAVVIMYEHDIPFDKESQEAFELFAAKITSEIRDDEHFLSYGRAYHADMINKLLDGVITDWSIYTSQMQVMYDGFEDYLYVAVVDATQNDTQQNKLEFIKNLLVGKHPSYKYAIYSNYIVMIMSSNYKDFRKELFFDKRHDFFTQNNLFVGVSGSFENIYELRKYYNVAVDALKSGIEKNSDQRVFPLLTKNR